MEQKFSVLLNVYAKDRPAWIYQALDSVLHNTVCPNEVVIMVDGPVGPDIQTVLNEATKNQTVRILSSPKNIGRGAALAYAVPRCTYDLIALMDADDVCRKDRFEKQLTAFCTTPDLAVCGGQIQEVDAESFAFRSTRNVPLTHEKIKQYLTRRMPFNNVTVMFKKVAVLEAGNYQSFGMVEDYYMWARVIAKGNRTQNVADVLVDVRVGKDMYNRRSGWDYFYRNKLLFDKMRALGLVDVKNYYYSLSIRFFVQVLMPNWLRSIFYERALR